MQRLERVETRVGYTLEVGKMYILGIAHCGWILSHYEVVRIISVTIHNEYSTSYGCVYKNNTFCYNWDWPFWRGNSRIFSAEVCQGFDSNLNRSTY